MLDAQLNAFREGKEAYQSALRNPYRWITSRSLCEEIRDAITSAQIAQQEHPSALIAVADRLTGRLVAQLAF